MKTRKIKQPVRVLVFAKDGSPKLDYIMDYKEREQVQRLGRGCMDALKAGEAVCTIPEGHADYETAFGVGSF